MKTTAALLITMLMCMTNVMAQETIEVTQGEKEIVSEQLDKEADSHQDSKTRELLKKVSEAFKNSKRAIELEIEKSKEDCANCSKEEKAKSIMKRLGMGLGKGAAWLSTVTARPFMRASGFIKGSVEKEDKNKDLVGLYQFLLNHQQEFDNLYLEAGTPQEMVELMIAKTEDIISAKADMIVKDFIVMSGIRAEAPEDLSKFELTSEELSKLNITDANVELVNQHPEYLELKPFLGNLTKEDVNDMLISGYFSKSIAYEKYKAALPTIYEAAGTIVGQVYAPKIALGVISKSLAGLYSLPVVTADIATGVSAAVCSSPANQEKFATDKELKTFCSFVVNRTGYELSKSRAKGYISGKKFHSTVARKIKEFKEKRAAKKKQRELEKQQQELEQQTQLP